MNARWFRAFSDNPQVAVKDLFNGRAGVGSSMRLEVPELLRLWFPPDLTEERAQLDRALHDWLVEMRESYTSQVERLGFSVFSKRIVDALIALQLLDLPQARDEIRDGVDAWLRWLSPLRLAPERDPALECHRLLTHGQPDSRHAATWLRLAADRRSEYLTVALAGLGLLPNDGDASKNQALMLQALLRHATTKFHEASGALKFFNREFGALRGLYPRAPGHWRHVLEESLPEFQRQAPSKLAIELAKELQERQLSKRKLRRSRRKSPTPEQVWTTLLEDIGNPSNQPKDLARRLFNVLEQNDDYASETGDSAPFVKSLSNLGSKLLLRGRLETSDMARLHTMIERALVWAPTNAYCWTIWAKWFQVMGKREAQEAVLRETLRLFPYNVVAQVELARVLIRRGEDHWQEAEHYLNRTLGQDPDDGPAHSVLEYLQYSRTQTGEAGELVHERSQTTSQEDNAGEHPMSSVSVLQEVLRRGSLAEEFSLARFAGGPAAHGGLIWQESRVGDSLAGFYSQWLQPDDTPACPPNAWAWNACLHWRQGAALEAWRDLSERFPEAATETEFLCGLAHPESARGDGQRYHRGPKGGASGRAVDILIREMADTRAQLIANHSATQHERDEAACAVMACAAANTPEFAASFD